MNNMLNNHIEKQLLQLIRESVRQQLKKLLLLQMIYSALTSKIQKIVQFREAVLFVLKAKIYV